MLKHKYTIFYSWQSDIQKNRNDINNCIEKAIKSLRNADDITLELNLDRDTKNRTGSPSITETIFNKISQCDVFICDITLVNNSRINRFNKARVTPNPNVLIELGYAISKLGWERIICVNNTSYGKNELLPFDIRGHRITTYNIKDSDYKAKLTDTLKYAISVIIGDYTAILNRHTQQGHIKHDKDIYDKVTSLCDETILKESIDRVVNNLNTNEYYYNVWDRIIHFYQNSINHFIDSDIDTEIKAFLKDLDTFRSVCYQKFFPTELSKEAMSEQDYIDAGIEITHEVRDKINQSQAHAPNKEPFAKESYDDKDKRIHKLQVELNELGEKVYESHRQFIYTIKRKGIIT